MSITDIPGFMWDDLWLMPWYVSGPMAIFLIGALVMFISVLRNQE